MSQLQINLVLRRSQPSQGTMNKTGSNSGHFVKYWVKLTLLKYNNKMVKSDQKRKINGMAPKIPKVYQVWQLSCYSTQLEKLNLGAFLKMATNWTSFVHSAVHEYINRIILFSKGKYNSHWISYMKLFSKKRWQLPNLF